MTNIIGKYIADKKIKDVEDVEEKTYLGAKKVRVIYEQLVGETETKVEDDILPEAVAESIASDLPYDLTTLRDKRVNPILEQIISIIAEGDIEQSDINYVLNRIPTLLQFNFDKAVDKLFGKPQYKVTLQDVDKVLKS